MSQKKPAGHVIVDTLVAHGVKRVYSVPGESYLNVLDGLYDSPIDNIVCRHEGGAAYMAEAEGKMNSTPGVAMVTRGPGASNAHVGLHTAWQDSTPMVLFVGLIPFEHRDKEAFQEFDPHAWFDSGAKRVMVLDHAERASEIVAEAMFAAASGRPGPVIVGLPEDVITHEIDARLHPQIPVAGGGMTVDDWKALHSALLNSDKPLFITGGNDWSHESAEELTRWLEDHHIAAAAEWRTEGTIPFDSPSYVGPIGYGRPKPTYDLLEETDLIVFVGTVPGDTVTDGFRVRQNWEKTNFLVTIDPSLRGRSGPVSYQIVAKPALFIHDLVRMDLEVKDSWKTWTAKMRAQQEEFAALPEITGEGPATMDEMMAHLVAALPAPQDPMVTFGAGEHTNWAHRYFPTRSYASMISARNGSMGYSVPSGVAASLNYPDRRIITIAGDGEFLMNGQELATARQYGATPLVIVMDNQEYGTIRTHQERDYPGRVSGTQLFNPDFAGMAEAFGGFGVKVTHNAEIPAALERALKAVDEDGTFALIHLVVEQRRKAY
ncbi:thiamine pyrophosphate-dependent enzyme [Auritidibacter ignavus]|uniref:thiamine pyrophosphate-dependent enzyme n=1 Tax=Auritidibacter ignavus TaxID=678932 RepID=UPI000F0430B8|nr:thiamine pyrophosphate-dependent enzyme [Auritidibacter ignavus]NIH71088.1 acetolactate synthase-1/2/3 large subunit [Auritidibacter ignavus]RMX22387.1 acetolactate synthase [Auritidibacter ignavus]WGH81231.1 thiamine pyrophosphate-binding protein [Auritidibacter ignavus]WGH83480.1 thiamine pyrophosphate-binding protein [Auritidibacter ignavus]WGH85815.1 thiamine pyrophosphate-binding protein [Auritidibacter ignavus]